MSDNTQIELLEKIADSVENQESTLIGLSNALDKDRMYDALNQGKIVTHLGRIAVALEQLAGIVDQPEEKQPTTTNEPKNEKAETPEPFTYTHDDLKNVCLKTAREDQDNKAKLKALLKEYGASKAVDVPKDKLEEVITKINKGEF